MSYTLLVTLSPAHYNTLMRLILSHENADFDAVASQLAAALLPYPNLQC